MLNSTALFTFPSLSYLDKKFGIIIDGRTSGHRLAILNSPVIFIWAYNCHRKEPIKSTYYGGSRKLGPA